MAELTKDRSAELSALSKQQFAALEKATFLGMTIEETVEYDNRHARIGEICREIDKFKAASFFRAGNSNYDLLRLLNFCHVATRHTIHVGNICSQSFGNSCLKAR